MADNSDDNVKKNYKGILGNFLFFIVVIIAGYYSIGNLFSRIRTMSNPIDTNEYDLNEDINWNQYNSSFAPVKVVPINAFDHILGSKNAKVSIIVYTDLDCQYCKDFHLTMISLLEEFGEKVNWVFRHAPDDEIHPYSFIKSQGAECAGSIGGELAFWEYVNYMFENQSKGENSYSLAFEYINLDKQASDFCMDSKQFEKLVINQRLQAIVAGATGTPHLIILSGDTQIQVSGAVSYDELANYINSL